MQHSKREKVKEKCRRLRREGRSLNDIMKTTELPKTTVYGYIKNVVLTEKQRRDIERRRRILLKRPSPRKGKSKPGREIAKPSGWSAELVSAVAHFVFDGHIKSDGCIYYNRSKSQIDGLRSKVYRLFEIKPIEHVRPDGVRLISYYNVEFADFIRNKANEIFSYIEDIATKEEKRKFLQAFFDDEGNIYLNKSTRRIRGYQKSVSELKTIKKIMGEFGIYGTIYPKIGAIEIAGRDQLKKFSEEIDFSPGIAINPLRKNGVWDRDIEKRKILDLALASYVNRGA